MFDIKRAKDKAARMVRENYVILVIACLLASFLGSAYQSSLSYLQSSRPESIKELLINRQSDTLSITADSVIMNVAQDVIGDKLSDYGIDISDLNKNESGVYEKILEGNFEEGDRLSKEIMDNAESQKLFNVVELGVSKGILSGVVNNINSGNFLVVAFQTIQTVFKSDSVATSIFVVISALIMLAITIFLKDMYKIAFRRVFMEGHKYSHIKFSSFLFLYRVDKSINASLNIFITNVYQFFWNFTIIGGIIKHYSYFMVPYIVAENPSIKYKDAIKLSRDMMDGHKFECFKYELTFIGWKFIGILTFGVSELLFSNAYKESCFVEYYAYIRSLAQKANIKNSNLMNDNYLLHVAPQELLNETYADVIEIMNDDIILENYKHKGIRGFLEDNLGLIYKYDKDEDGYNVAIEQEEKIDQYKYQIEGKQYPERLFPNYKEQLKNRLEQTHYLRHYSIWSVVVLFFVFCFIGWSWEVMLHLVKDGLFVNRGVLHGPWLPIYGSGGALILMFLFRFRRNIGKEALAAIILCGIVEYSTSWFLEMTKGTKWWDYSGYYLNINGRICAEGLIVFMIGGLAVVYFLAPIIDNFVRKANKKILIPICCALLLIFTVDVIYSQKYPNTGKGITDYGTQEIIE